MPELRSTLIETAKNYIAGFNTNTADGVVACRTTDCKQIMYPSSNPPPWSNSPFNNEQYQSFVVPGFQLVRNVRIALVEGEDMVVDEVSQKVVLHLKSTGETIFGPYSNDMMIVLKMVEDGTMIKEIVEFIDSATAQAVTAGLAQEQRVT